MKKLILNFNSKDSRKIKNPKNFLGGKGANLSEMGRMGLPVPPGFTISTKVCEIFYKDKKKLNKNLISQIKKELKLIEKDVSKKFEGLKKSTFVVCAVWCKSINARYDGYYSKSGSER